MSGQVGKQTEGCKIAYTDINFSRDYQYSKTCLQGTPQYPRESVPI